MKKDNLSKNNKEAKQGKGLKIFLIIIAIILAIIIPLFTIFTIYVKKNFDYNYNKITSKPQDLGYKEEKDDKVINIALFGVDSDNNSFKGRSDCIIILSVDTGKKKVKLISVLRDSLVPIDKSDERVFSKINSAYSTGGAELAIKTLNQVFALDISEYVTVDFGGLVDIIDAVDGIDITITDSELTKINGTVNAQAAKYGGEASNYLLSSSGNVHLNGIQALTYSRIRSTANAWGTNNDYGRSDRQRHVLENIFNKAKQMKMSKIINLLKIVAPSVETSLSYTECISLASKVMMNSPTFEETRVPATNHIMNPPKTEAGSVVYYDLNFAANLINAFIYQDIPPQEYEKIKGIQKNDWYVTGYFAPVIEEVKIEAPQSE